MKRSLVATLIENSKTPKTVAGEIGKVPYEKMNTPNNHLSGKGIRPVDGKKGLGEQPKRGRKVTQVVPPKNKERRRMTEGGVGDVVNSILGFMMKMAGPKFGRRLYTQMKEQEPEMYQQLVDMFKSLIAKGAITDRAQMQILMQDPHAHELAMRVRAWAHDKLPPEFDQWASKKAKKLGMTEDNPDDETLRGVKSYSFMMFVSEDAAKQIRQNINRDPLVELISMKYKPHRIKNNRQAIFVVRGEAAAILNWAKKDYFDELELEDLHDHLYDGMTETLGDNPDSKAVAKWSSAKGKDEGQKNPPVAKVKGGITRKGKLGKIGDNKTNGTNIGKTKKLPASYAGGETVAVAKIKEGLADIAAFLKTDLSLSSDVMAEVLESDIVDFPTGDPIKPKSRFDKSNRVEPDQNGIFRKARSGKRDPMFRKFKTAPKSGNGRFGQHRQSADENASGMATSSSAVPSTPSSKHRGQLFAGDINEHGTSHAYLQWEKIINGIDKETDMQDAEMEFTKDRRLTHDEIEELQAMAYRRIYSHIPMKDRIHHYGNDVNEAGGSRLQLYRDRIAELKKANNISALRKLYNQLQGDTGLTDYDKNELEARITNRRPTNGALDPDDFVNIPQDPKEWIKRFDYHAELHGFDWETAIGDPKILKRAMKQFTPEEFADRVEQNAQYGMRESITPERFVKRINAYMQSNYLMDWSEAGGSNNLIESAIRDGVSPDRFIRKWAKQQGLVKINRVG